jgi:hypothetical protein
MDERIAAFIEENPAAAMISLRADGSAQAVRVGVGIVGGKLWSSGTKGRLRTKLLRRDPRCTLLVFEGGSPGYRFLTLETVVTILDGPDAPDLNVRFFLKLQAHMTPPPEPGHLSWFGKQKTIEEFRQAMLDEGRLIYQFQIERAYGMY